MKVLIVEPGKRPIKANIPHTLQSLQQTVGGTIQAIYPWNDPVALVCDDEGLLKQREFNRYVAPEVVIFGTFFICGLGEEDLTSLPENLLQKYAKRFQHPELFLRVGNQLMVVPF